MIFVIDSHTAGEPTRLVVQGGPDLGAGTVKEQLDILRAEHDSFRSAVVNEPRGSDILVGALLCKAADPNCAAGVIFFNNVGYLGMCGHGMIGVATTLAHLKSLSVGEFAFETPVGIVRATILQDGRVSIRNVPSFRERKNLEVDVPGIGIVRGDVAWSGNWFFLIEEHGQDLHIGNVEQLTDYAWRIRQALNAGPAPDVDHIELFGPAQRPGNNSRSFVLCPGKAYDRSPCGTGTSAKLACLHADGKLRPGEIWKQESIIGSVFEASYELSEAGEVIPTITGRAHITGETKLLFDPLDPFVMGIRA